MAAHRKPANVLEFARTDGGHPERLAKRKAEQDMQATQAPLGDAPNPTRLLTWQDAWDEVVATARESKVLCSRDRIIVESAARLHMRLHNMWAIQVLEGNPMPTTDMQAQRALTVLMSKMGSAPDSVGKVIQPPAPKEESEFDD